MKRSFSTIARKFYHNVAGSMAIETAFVLPTLVVLSLGTFEAGMLVSREYELQSVAAEAEIIAIAAASGASTDNDKVKDILKASVGLDEDQITLERLYRCNDNESTVSSIDSCMEDDVVTSYIRLNVTDSYTPVWTEFGIGETVDFEVERTVLLS